MKELPDDSSFNYHFEIRESKVVRSEFEDSEEPLNVRLAVLMRPLTAPGSEINLRLVWQAVKALATVEDEVVRNIDEALEGKNPNHAMTSNGEPLTEEDIYEMFSAGEFFGEDGAAKKKLDALRFGPMREMVWMHFYSHASRMYSIASAVLDVAATHLDLSPEKEHGRCVYCGAEDGVFTSEEHIIPEAFGNDEAVLPIGYVCDACNNICSKLDQFLSDCELLSFGKVMNVGFTKKGKLPKAEFDGVMVHRRLPRVLSFRGKDVFGPVEQLPNGEFKLNLSLRGKNPLDHMMLGRALFKIGLGFVAFDEGREAALNPRYDSARRFVLDGVPIASDVLLQRKGLLPDAGIEVMWQRIEGAGTLFKLKIFGVVIVFNLEPLLRAQASDPDLKGFLIFPMDDVDWMPKLDAPQGDE